MQKSRGDQREQLRRDAQTLIAAIQLNADEIRGLIRRGEMTAAQSRMKHAVHDFYARMREEADEAPSDMLNGCRAEVSSRPPSTLRTDRDASILILELYFLEDVREFQRYAEYLAGYDEEE